MTRKILPDLSIIVPCFNSAATLTEAIDSIYTQGLEVPFEVIAVDDGSNDGTTQLIQELMKVHSEIHFYSHPQNLGGGAARNTGIQKAKGKLILCLDSDNILQPNSLPLLIQFLQVEKLDGVAFHHRKYFFGQMKKIGSTHSNPVASKTFSIDDVFNNSGMVLDNFLYTKAAFMTAGGYPTHHDFDTQGFEVRFLAQNLKVRACPGSMIWHRQRAKKLSYFERVYEKGEFSRNMYLIIEEIFHLFAESIKEFLIEFDLAEASLTKNILSELVKIYQTNPAHFFIPHKEKYLRSDGLQQYCRHQAKSRQKGDRWCLAIDAYQTQHYSVALQKYLSMLNIVTANTVYWNILRCSVALSQKDSPSQVEKKVTTIISELQLTPQKSILRKSFLVLVLNKIVAQLKKILR